MDKKSRLIKKLSELENQKKQLAAQMQLLKRQEAAKMKKTEDRLKYILGGSLLENASKLDIHKVVEQLEAKDSKWVDDNFPSLVKFELEAPNE